MTNFNEIAAIALFHKTLSEPIRLRILMLLKQRESLCVCDLVSVLDLSQSTVSRHLSYLKNHHLVNSWREGNWIHYALKADHPLQASLQAMLESLQACAEIQADIQALIEYEKQPRSCSLK